MTKNKIDKKTILTRRTGFQTDHILLLEQFKEKKANPSLFLKFLFADPHCTYLILLTTQAEPSQN